MQVGKRRHVEAQVRRHALRIAESIEDGKAHIRNGNLREQAAVHVFDQKMDRGLRVHGDLNARGGRQVEEAARFDDLQALVEEGRGVYRDAASITQVG